MCVFLTVPSFVLGHSPHIMHTSLIVQRRVTTARISLRTFTRLVEPLPSYKLAHEALEAGYSLQTFCIFTKILSTLAKSQTHPNELRLAQNLPIGYLFLISQSMKPFKALMHQLVSTHTIDDVERKGRCENQAVGRKCPNGMCCSKYGWCGTTLAHCSPKNCQSQCKIPSPPPPSPPPPPSFPQGRCGNQAAGIKCPTGLCCSKHGWCGTTSAYCAPGKCQSQCKTTLTSSFHNPMKSFYFNVV
ncbi:hypothetical protein H5410_018400 [Solanum commersonii]|uniref:Chitin-binding type-1 domain-containing protein n=1 Tax=Solanum commersonii TaxID=4109 RepID=A0A9J6A2C0_SOLCO|nr:hypothetical protein H5410_018400 [Solanum commersonii]